MAYRDKELHVVQCRVVRYLIVIVTGEKVLHTVDMLIKIY